MFSVLNDPEKYHSLLLMIHVDLHLMNMALYAIDLVSQIADFRNGTWHLPC